MHLEKGVQLIFAKAVSYKHKLFYEIDLSGGKGINIS
jgi:hypothetical protein